MSGRDGPVVVRCDFAQTDAAEGFQVNNFFIVEVFLQFWGSHNHGRNMRELELVFLGLNSTEMVIYNHDWLQKYIGQQVWAPWFCYPGWFLN